MQKIATLEYDEHRLSDELYEKREKIKEGKEILEKARQAQRDREKYENTIDEYIKWCEQENIEDIEHTYADVSDKLDNFCVESDKEIEELKKKIDIAVKERDAFEETPTYDLEVEYDDYTERQQKFNQELGATEKSIKDLTLVTEEIKLLEEGIKDTKKNLKESTFWVKGFIDVRRMVIESALPNLESSINLYLTKLKMPLRVVIDTLKETKEGKLKDEFNINVKDLITGRIDNMETYSDGQKKRIGLAICFALNDLLRDKTYPFDFLLIDQLIDNDIDEIGVNLVMSILDENEKQKFIISHRPELKEKFKNLIWLVMENGITKLEN